MAGDTENFGGNLAVAGTITQGGGLVAPPGIIVPFAGLTAPAGWLLCAGQAVSRSTYASLFAAVTAALGAATVTIASPSVFTLAGHGLVAGDAVYLTTTGALPTGFTANTTYYVTATSLTANTFTLAATLGGAAINGTGTQSGTHTVTRAPFGGITATNFNLPDLRGRVPAGLDNIGGTDAGRLSWANAPGTAAGAETHTLQATEMPSHTHQWTLDARLNAAGLGNFQLGYASATGTAFSAPITTTSAGGGGAHNNMQPTILLNYLIKT